MSLRPLSLPLFCVGVENTRTLEYSTRLDSAWLGARLEENVLKSLTLDSQLYDPRRRLSTPNFQRPINPRPPQTRESRLATFSGSGPTSGCHYGNSWSQGCFAFSLHLGLCRAILGGWRSLGQSLTHTHDRMAVSLSWAAPKPLQPPVAPWGFGPVSRLSCERWQRGEPASGCKVVSHPGDKSLRRSYPVPCEL